MTKNTLPTATVRNSVPIPIKERVAKFVSFKSLVDKEEHVALDFRKEGALPDVIDVRIHSECLTGDIFGSGRCDCGEQLDESVRGLSNSGGVLLYMRQEGRGIGLYAKLDAYELQLQGHDTYTANQMLGLGDDLRDYRAAAQMLLAMGISKINLITNNPLKVAGISKWGIEVVKAIPTGVFLKRENASYLKAKVEKTGHSINLDLDSE